jgi:hypothetical protein
MVDQSDDLTRRAERSRNHLAELVDNLQSQITPARLVGQFVGHRGVKGGDPSLTELLTAQVSRNPLACMLIAAGIGWLMISERADKKLPMRRTVAGTGRRRAAAKRPRPRKKIPV